MSHDLNQLHSFLESHKNKNYQYQPLPPGSPYDQIEWMLKKCTAPWLRLLIDAPFELMLNEARSLRHRFVLHREDDGQGWRSLCIHGISAEHTNSWQSYGYANENEIHYDWTDIKDQAPVTVAYFRDNFPYVKYQRLRFMLVEPKGYIMPHSDNQNNNLAAAVNISLNNPEGCRLVSEMGTVPYSDQGSVFLFNNHYTHAVFNDSDQDRFHIIVHGQWDPSRWNTLVCESYMKAANG